MSTGGAIPLYQQAMSDPQQDISVKKELSLDAPISDEYESLNLDFSKYRGATEMGAVTDEEIMASSLLALEE